MSVLALTASRNRRVVQASDHRNDSPRQAHPDDGNVGVLDSVLTLLESVASTGATIHSSQRA